MEKMKGVKGKMKDNVNDEKGNMKEIKNYIKKKVINK
jgi:hypothetical protein